MKKIKNTLLAFLACIVAFCGTAVFANADVVYSGDDTFVTTNVAAGKLVSFTDKDGVAIPEGYLHDLHGGALNYGALTDGDAEPGMGHSIIQINDENGPVRAFAVLDLGEKRTINEIGVCFWNDHNYGGIVMQVADSADFSDAIMVWNNDVANVMGQGAGEEIQYKDTPGAIQHVKVSPVAGRYVRVSGYSLSEGQTRFSEIEVYGVTSGFLPVTANKVSGKASKKDEITLSTMREGAKIYYTTDGTLPSVKSTEYTAPIKLGDIEASKVLIRAVSVADGKSSAVSDFKFDTAEKSVNVALGKIGTTDGVEPKAFQGTATMEKVTDGAEDPFNVMGTDTPSWLKIDLGKVYAVDTVKVKLFHDWAFGAIVQLSETEDFSSGNYTVFSNYGNNSFIWTGVEEVAATTAEWWGGGMHTFEFSPVKARYIRIFSYSVQNENKWSVWEEVQVWTAVKPDSAYPAPAENVAFGKIGTTDGAEPKAFQGTATMEKVTDGAEDPFNVMGTDTPSWLKIDLGKVYAVDTVKVKLFHDWAFGAIVQLSETEDFSSGNYTVFSNYGNNSFIWTGVEEVAATTAEWWGGGMHTFEFSPVKARYIRIFSYSVQNENKWSVWEEVQVWSVAREASQPEDEYPVAEKAIVKADISESITVPFGTAADNLGLLKQVNVEDANGISATLNGNWVCEGYNPEIAGEYVFTYVFTLDGFVDVYGLLRTTVTVAEKADKTSLKAKIDEVEALDKEKYVTDSQSKLTKGLADAKAVYVNQAVFQQDVDDELAQLTKIVNDLILRGDKTELEKEISEINALNASDYSAESWSELTEKLEMALEVKNNADATQNVVDLALENLKAARSALRKLGDKTELQAKYDQLKSVENVYTNASWKSFSEKLSEAKALLDKSEAYEDELKTALDSLTAAYEKLVRKANFGDLTEALEEADSLDKSLYTPDSLEGYNAAVEAAKTVAANDESSQDAIDLAKANIDSAKALLVRKGNKTELNALIAGLGKYTQDRYTANSYNKFLLAKEEAEAVAADDNATQETVNAAKAELEKKIAALKELANKTELLATIEESEAVTEEEYTAASFAAFEEALNYAKEVAASNTVEQSDVDEANAALVAARNALVKKANGCASSYGGESLIIVLFAFVAIAALKRKQKQGVK